MSHTALFRLLAGKSGEGSGAYWLPLWVHAHDTAEMMKRLVNNRLSEAARNAIGLDAEALNRVAWFLGAVHDIGKATRLFQYTITRQLSDVRDRLRSIGAEVTEPRDSGKSHHTLMGEAIALELGCPRGLASIIGAHHGRPQEFMEVRKHLKSWENHYWASGQKDLWREVWQDFWQWALEGAGYASAEELPQLDVPAELLLTGLLTMADWIASNTYYFPLLDVEELGEEALWPKRANDAWNNLHLPSYWESLCQTMDADLFWERFGFLPNALQTTVMEVANAAEAPGLLIIEAQMGVGKTEAALAAAEVFAARFQCGGLFFGLPTQATANGLFTRLEKWGEIQSKYNRHSINLVHGAAELNEAYQALLKGTPRTEEDDPEAGLEVHPWFQGRKVKLLGEFIIGTVDQLLMAALKQKHVMLRQLGLAGKVVVVDECHAYDAYMSRYLDRALEWLGRWHVPVILLSATLPAGKRAELAQAYLGRTAPAGDWQTCRAYPLLTWASQGEVRQTVVTETAALRTVRVEHGLVDDLPQRLQMALREGGCAGVIVNTVRRAQELNEILRTTFPEEEGWKVVLFHSQFIQADRAELETELVKKVGKGKDSTPKTRNRLIVVGTQVMEQSLDIDFDFLVTELCPMDLLLQRVGRLHRHPRERPEPLREAVCLVLDTGDETFDPGSVAVYGEWLLWRTRRLLPDAITLPTDLPRLVHDTYGWEQNDPLAAEYDSSTNEYMQEYELQRKKKGTKAEQYAIVRPREARKWLDGLLRKLPVSTDIAARAAVRDGELSIEVLVMVKETDGSVHFLPWQYDGIAVNTDVKPSTKTCYAIRKQLLRLPRVFSREDRIGQCIHCLEKRNTVVKAWQEAPLLRGELVLLFEKKGEVLTTELSGVRLTYMEKVGLVYEEL